MGIKFVRSQKGEIAATLTLISLGVMLAGTLMGSFLASKQGPDALTKAQQPQQPAIVIQPFSPKEIKVKTEGNKIGRVFNADITTREKAEAWVTEIFGAGYGVRESKVFVKTRTEGDGSIAAGNPVWDVYNKETGTSVAQYQPDCGNLAEDYTAVLTCDYLQLYHRGVPTAFTTITVSFGLHAFCDETPCPCGSAPCRAFYSWISQVVINQGDEMIIKFPKQLKDLIEKYKLRIHVTDLQLDTATAHLSLGQPDDVICGPSPTPTATLIPTATVNPTATPTPTVTPTPTMKLSKCNGECNPTIHPAIGCEPELICWYGPSPTPRLGAFGICRNPNCPEEENCVCKLTPTPTATPTGVPPPTNTPVQEECKLDADNVVCEDKRCEVGNGADKPGGGIADATTKLGFNHKSIVKDAKDSIVRQSIVPFDKNGGAHWHPNPLQDIFRNTTADVSLMLPSGWKLVGTFCDDFGSGKGCVQADSAGKFAGMKLNCGVDLDYGWIVTKEKGPTSPPTGKTFQLDWVNTETNEGVCWVVWTDGCSNLQGHEGGGGGGLSCSQGDGKDGNTNITNNTGKTIRVACDKYLCNSCSANSDDPRYAKCQEWNGRIVEVDLRNGCQATCSWDSYTANVNCGGGAGGPPAATATPTPKLVGLTVTPPSGSRCSCPVDCSPGRGGCWWGDGKPNQCDSRCCSEGKCPSNTCNTSLGCQYADQCAVNIGQQGCPSGKTCCIASYPQIPSTPTTPPLAPLGAPCPGGRDSECQGHVRGTTCNNIICFNSTCLKALCNVTECDREHLSGTTEVHFCGPGLHRTANFPWCCPEAESDCNTYCARPDPLCEYWGESCDSQCIDNPDHVNWNCINNWCCPPGVSLPTFSMNALTVLDGDLDGDGELTNSDLWTALSNYGKEYTTPTGQTVTIKAEIVSSIVSSLLK